MGRERMLKNMASHDNKIDHMMIGLMKGVAEKADKLVEDLKKEKALSTEQSQNIDDINTVFYKVHFKAIARTCNPFRERDAAAFKAKQEAEAAAQSDDSDESSISISESDEKPAKKAPAKKAAKKKAPAKKAAKKAPAKKAPKKKAAKKAEGELTFTESSISISE